MSKQQELYIWAKGHAQTLMIGKVHFAIVFDSSLISKEPMRLTRDELMIAFGVYIKAKYGSRRILRWRIQ